MKLHLSFLLLLIGFELLAQNTTTKEETLALHQAGKAFLQKRVLRAFDKIQALEQFQLSQKKIRTANLEYPELEIENEQEVQKLHNFFAAFQNIDSVLRLTRFFPDSVFQSDTRYSSQSKLLINNYLALKKGAVRKEFLKFKNLNYSHPSEQTSDTSFKITFENYWPLELMEFEQWLQKNETELDGFPQNARKELLRLRLQHQLDSLTNWKIVDDHSSNTKYLLEKTTQLEKETEAIKSQHRQLKYLILGIVGTLFIAGYFFWQKNIQQLKSKYQMLLEEKKRSDDLLANMLPNEVVRQLKNKEAAKARRYESVCVLFSDFQNFSQISKNLPPEELVRELDHCFTAFDSIIEKYRLQKIKTIGDAYMCVGGLYTRGGNHVQRMVSAALEIQQFLRSRKTQRDRLGGYFFEARVGVHTGPVVAGIIGTNKIAFDVWGDTVNVAQQMEQHGEVGKVNISGETHELVKDKFKCVHRREITVKNRKTYSMYFVNNSASGK